MPNIISTVDICLSAYIAGGFWQRAGPGIGHVGKQRLWELSETKTYRWNIWYVGLMEWTFIILKLRLKLEYPRFHKQGIFFS